MTGFLDRAISSIGGDPASDGCDACGWPWRLDPEDALEAVRGAPKRYQQLLSEADDPYRTVAPLTWSAAAYTWHVADVCRAWSERAVALDREPDRELVGFDQDELAAARGYASMSASAAVWALGRSARTLAETAEEIGLDTPFDHPDWGPGTLGDAIRWVAHELIHHELDVRLSLG